MNQMQPLKEVEHDIGWNDLICWSTAFYLLARRKIHTLRLSDLFLADGLFLPRFLIVKKALENKEESINRIKRKFELNPNLSCAYLIEEFVQHQKWLFLVKNLSELGIHFVADKVNNLKTLNEFVPCVVLSNTYYLPYWKPDYLCNHGGLLKCHHTLLVHKVRAGIAYIQDPALSAYDGKIAQTILCKAMTDHQSLPGGFEGKVYRLSNNSEPKPAYMNGSLLEWRLKLINTAIQQLSTPITAPSDGKGDLINAVHFIFENLTDSLLISKKILPEWVNCQLMLLLIGYRGFERILENLKLKTEACLEMKHKIRAFQNTINSNQSIANDLERGLIKLISDHNLACLEVLSQLKEKAEKHDD